MAELKKLEEELNIITKELNLYYDYFSADGVIDSEEKKYLDILFNLIETIENRISELKKPNISDSADKIIKKGIVKVDGLNIRKGPSTKNDKDGVLNKGAKINIYEINGSWLRIDKNKWVHGNYVSLKSVEENQGNNQSTNGTSQNNTTPAQNNNLPAGNNPIKKAVGDKNSTNDPADVITIKKLLVAKGYQLTINGNCDDDLIAAITAYQKDKMKVKNPDGRIDPGKNTWKHLNGIAISGGGGYTGATKGFRPQNQQDLDWESETETEKKLEKFFDDFTHLKVLVNPGETPPKYVEVVPVYEINSQKKTQPNGNPIADLKISDGKGGIRQSLSVSEYWSKFPSAAKNSKVYKIRQKLPWNARAGKATPVEITKFLNDCVKENLIPASKRTKEGFRKFMIDYEVGVDCTGLVSQALNFLNDGNLDYNKGDDPFNINNGMDRSRNKFKVINKPSLIKAGDYMKLEKKGRTYGHVRIVVDVDKMPDNSIQLRSIESAGSGMNSGVGAVLWRYKNPDTFDGLERSDDNGQTWYASSEHKTRDLSYQRWDKLESLENKQ